MKLKKFLKKVIDKAYIEKFKLTHNILNNLIENSNKKFNLWILFKIVYDLKKKKGLILKIKFKWLYEISIYNSNFHFPLHINYETKFDKEIYKLFDIFLLKIPLYIIYNRI